MDNSSGREEKITYPSLEDWRRIYDAAVDFRKIAPWEWMWDSDIFGVQPYKDGEVGYCCVLGRNREVFGLVVYLGPEGLEGYLRVVSGNFDIKDPDALHIKKCLLASFEDKKDLSKDDADVIRQLGLRFEGENTWPQFRSYRPGYFPWRLTKDEAVFLTLCLEQSKNVCSRFKDFPDMLKPLRPSHYFTRVAKKENDILKWDDERSRPFPYARITG